MQLYYDKPTSLGVENALKRARQLADIRWTPVETMPSGLIRTTTVGKKYLDTFLSPWRERQGIPYSSVRIHEKYVGYNVSFETFVTAMANPRSVMYTKPQHGLGRSMFSYYGTVCSAYASYVCGLPFRLTCSQWIGTPGVTPVDTTELENLQLCDLVLDPKSHVAVVTGIQRDVDGKVHLITVSESETPVCSTNVFTAQGFRKHWLERGYSIYRYAGVHDVTYTPDPFIPVEGDPPMEAPFINPSLLPDYGNKANYMLGETVELDVMEEGWSEIRVFGPEEHVLAVEDGKAAFVPAKPGFYTACCTGAGGDSQPVQFCVTQLDIQGDRDVLSVDESLTVTFSQAGVEDEALGWIAHNLQHSMKKSGFFTETEKAEKRFSVRGLKPGDYYVFVLCKNEYGLYKSEGFSFRVEG